MPAAPTPAAPKSATPKTTAPKSAATTTPIGLGLLPVSVGAATTAIAGYVDAIGFSHLAGLYLSFMSGNSTQLGTVIAAADWGSAGIAAAVVAVFVAGAFAGTLMAERPGARAWRVLAVETVLLAAAALAAVAGATGWVSALPAVLAMGMQNILIGRAAGADIGKGYVTGTLVGVGQALARALAARRFPSTALAHLAAWTLFILGAVAGAAVLTRLGWPAALAIAAGLVAVLALACRLRRI